MSMKILTKKDINVIILFKELLNQLRNINGVRSMNIKPIRETPLKNMIKCLTVFSKDNVLGFGEEVMLRE